MTRWGPTLAFVVIAAAVTGCSAQAAALPYYRDSTFTPTWTPVGHSVTAHVLSDTPFLDQEGAAWTPAQLHGRVHVASFVFTTCASICPPLVSQLKKVQEVIASEALAADLVSYSITPGIDTVDVLAEFGRRRGIDPRRWHLLTGTATGVGRLAVDLYFADDDGDRAGVAAGALLHTEKVLLVDEDGHIRGVYNGTQSFEIQKLIEDLRTLSRP